MQKRKSLPETLGWVTAGYDEYRKRQKDGRSKKSLQKFLNRDWLVGTRRASEIIIELYWQIESLRAFLEEVYQNICKEDVKNAKEKAR